jgi:hypothetical protein
MGVQEKLIVSAVGTGSASWLGFMKDIALELLGVPLPVVLAAATAAFFAGSFRPATGFGRAFTAGICWTLLAVFMTNLIAAAIAYYAGAPVAAGALAGIAVLAAGAGQLLCPLLWPVIVARLPAALARRIDQLGGTFNDTRNS